MKPNDRRGFMFLRGEGLRAQLLRGGSASMVLKVSQTFFEAIAHGRSTPAAAAAPEIFARSPR